MKHPKVCTTCLHFDKVDHTEGDCTRYPEWKSMPTDHYCGEHEYNLVIQGEIEKIKEHKLMERARKEGQYELRCRCTHTKTINILEECPQVEKRPYLRPVFRCTLCGMKRTAAGSWLHPEGA